MHGPTRCTALGCRWKGVTRAGQHCSGTCTHPVSLYDACLPDLLPEHARQHACCHLPHLGLNHPSNLLAASQQGHLIIHSLRLCNPCLHLVSTELRSARYQQHLRFLYLAPCARLPATLPPPASSPCGLLSCLTPRPGSADRPPRAAVHRFCVPHPAHRAQPRHAGPPGSVRRRHPAVCCAAPRASRT